MGWSEAVLHSALRFLTRTPLAALPGSPVMISHSFSVERSVQGALAL